MKTIFSPTLLRSVLILALVGAVLGLSGAASFAEDTAQGEGDIAVKPVVLTIDFGDGVQKRFPLLVASEKTTALSVLDTAAKHPRGIRYQHRGKGATAFVTSIDGLKNSGGGKKARNWTFRVNGKLANQSAALTKLAPGDELIWKYALLSEVWQAK